MKSGNLNFLEPSGSLQACNRTALPLPLPLCTVYSRILRKALAITDVDPLTSLDDDLHLSKHATKAIKN
jgi:hypothetical protein